MDLDLYGQPSPFAPGDRVKKTGSGYSGPGYVFISFLGEDQHWRHVVGHRIEDGVGTFYHVYGSAQLSRLAM